jgi:hypothetical protein
MEINISRDSGQKMNNSQYEYDEWEAYLKTISK